MNVERFDIRTSSRRVFRRCLRKWGYQSSMRSNLQRKGAETNINFWFGSAIHFAMEDYFGWNKFGDPRRTFKAYYDAFKPSERPEGAEEHYELGLAMLTYFLEWYPKHNSDMQFRTLWLNENDQPVSPNTLGARPAVEEEFTLDLGLRVVIDKNGKIIGTVENAMAEDVVRDDIRVVPICYHGTMDRIVVDRFDRWWILDYKTAKGADTRKLDTDDQISAYCWAAEQRFQHKIYGFIYLQLTKDVAKPPKRLKDRSLSVDKKQKTTYQLFRDELIKDYGAVNKAPNKMIEMLNHLADQDTPEGDRYIRWDFIQRNDAQKISTYNHIMGETKLMINPNLYLFPNPTRDCGWDCPFREICIATDQGREEDAKSMLEMDFEVRNDTLEHNEDDWREKIKWPDKPLAAAAIDDTTLKPTNIFNIELPAKYYSDYEEG